MDDKMDKKISVKVEKLLSKVRPYIQMHNGDVCLVSVKGGEVILKISGACADCSLSNLTYNKMIFGLLMEDVPEIKEIILEK